MNWLIYLCGGMLWTLLWIRMFQDFFSNLTHDYAAAMVFIGSIVGTWVWICVKLIR